MERNYSLIFQWSKALAIWLFFPIYGLYAQDGERDSVRRLEIVDVHAGQSLLVAPVPVQVLSKQTLQRINSLSVADAMRYFTGVQLKDYGGVGGLKTINVRSMGSEHTAVFYDGVQLGNAQNGQVDLGRFSLDNIEEIQLYNGQRPHLLQAARAYASASSIYMEARSPQWDADEKSRASASIKTGSFGLFNPAVNMEQRLGQNLSAQFNVELQNAHGKYPFRYQDYGYDTTATRQNGDVFSWRAEAALYGKPDTASDWSLRLYHYQSNRGLPRAVVSNRFEASQRLWDNNNFVQAKYKRRVNSRYQVDLQAKYGHDYSRYLDPEYITEDGFLNNIYKQQEAYISLANTYTLSKHWDIGFSTDYQYNELDANIYYFSYPHRHTWLAVASSSYRLRRLSVQGNLLSTYVSDRVRVFRSAGSRHVWSPTLLAQWQLFKQQEIYLRAFYKDIFRMPTFNDLYYTFIGNSYLRPEYTKQFNLGLIVNRPLSESAASFLAWQMDVYHNVVKDKIVAIPGANLFRWSMVNLDRVTVDGLETSLRLSGPIKEALAYRIGLNYTYQRALDKTPNGDTYGQQIPYMPLHAGSAMLGLDIRRFSLNYSFIYTGERYSQKANIPVNYVQPWYTHDVNFHFDGILRRHQYRIGCEVSNLLNQYYDVVLNFPMPGRNYRLSFKYQL